MGYQTHVNLFQPTLKKFDVFCDDFTGSKTFHTVTRLICNENTDINILARDSSIIDNFYLPGNVTILGLTSQDGRALNLQPFFRLTIWAIQLESNNFEIEALPASLLCLSLSADDDLRPIVSFMEKNGKALLPKLKKLVIMGDDFISKIQFFRDVQRHCPELEQIFFQMLNIQFVDNETFELPVKCHATILPLKALLHVANAEVIKQLLVFDYNHSSSEMESLIPVLRNMNLELLALFNDESEGCM